jgi:hypothetical protein
LWTGVGEVWWNGGMGWRVEPCGPEAAELDSMWIMLMMGCTVLCATWLRRVRNLVMQ